MRGVSPAPAFERRQQFVSISLVERARLPTGCFDQCLFTVVRDRESFRAFDHLSTDSGSACVISQPQQFDVKRVPVTCAAQAADKVARFIGSDRVEADLGLARFEIGNSVAVEPAMPLLSADRMASGGSRSIVTGIRLLPFSP